MSYHNADGEVKWRYEKCSEWNADGLERAEAALLQWAKERGHTWRKDASEDEAPITNDANSASDEDDGAGSEGGDNNDVDDADGLGAADVSDSVACAGDARAAANE